MFKFTVHFPAILTDPADCAFHLQKLGQDLRIQFIVLGSQNMQSAQSKGFAARIAVSRSYCRILSVSDREFQFYGKYTALIEFTAYRDRPPIRSMIFFVMASPNPVPWIFPVMLLFRRTNGSKIVFA